MVHERNPHLPTGQTREVLSATNATVKEEGRTKFEAEQERIRLDFEQDQEQKRLQFESTIEAKKAKRDWATVSVAIIAALFAGWSGYEAHKSRLDASEAARLDARPFVSIRPGYWEYESKSHVIVGHFDLVIKGKTPAFNLREASYCSGTPVPKNQTLLVALTRDGVADETISDTCAAEVGEGYDIRNSILIKGRVLYEDYYHGQHEADFCFMGLTGPFSDSDSSLHLLDCGNH